MNGDDSGELQPQRATSGLSSSLRVLAGTKVDQRYDAATDSYQLVSEQPSATAHSDTSKKRYQNNTSTVTLAREVSMLRKAYVELKERMEHGGGGGGAEANTHTGSILTKT